MYIEELLENSNFLSILDLKKISKKYCENSAPSQFNNRSNCIVQKIWFDFSNFKNPLQIDLWRNYTEQLCTNRAFQEQKKKHHRCKTNKLFSTYAQNLKKPQREKIFRERVTYFARSSLNTRTRRDRFIARDVPNGLFCFFVFLYIYNGLYTIQSTRPSDTHTRCT